MMRLPRERVGENHGRVDGPWIQQAIGHLNVFPVSGGVEDKYGKSIFLLEDDLGVKYMLVATLIRWSTDGKDAEAVNWDQDNARYDFVIQEASK